MAGFLASIFGTEKDKVNCSFYFKVGACRHGERCCRIHTKPIFSQTVLLQNFYIDVENSVKSAEFNTIKNIDKEIQNKFEEFYEDIFVECEEKYGEIEIINVCDNLGDHLVGNVYIKFRYEDDAKKAVEDLNNRWFDGRPIYAELSPVEDFQDACCRQYEVRNCRRNRFCNFLHVKRISSELKRYLYRPLRQVSNYSTSKRVTKEIKEARRSHRKRSSYDRLSFESS
ncbi:splicing factor U2af 38 kDa subunit-like [Condylostylus longicornis]|uniref:splicing factor U2af 38 kDa subunit-like n=1 Tax=Condylostylus longicornis TaxID=2530218 RepID=UPI00244E31C0|nr:splicing factor U2af 38 kDa subunit-like [Condylostylus longicornis]